MDDPMRTGTGESWRDSVLRGVLTVTALLAPPVALIAVIGRGRDNTHVDVLALLAVGGALPILRLLPRISLAVRTAGMVTLLFAVSMFFVARNGFAPGPFLALTTAAVLATIYFGRRTGFLLIGLACVALVILGVLVTSGRLVLRPASIDPQVLRNWLRITFVTMLLAALLTMTVDVVIRHVEAGARATRDALMQLAALHSKLEAAKEDERRFLAHELHDELGQMLTVLKFRVQLDAGPSAGEALALVDDLIARVRKLSVDLRPPLLDEVGLVPALRAYVETQTATTGVAMQLFTDPSGNGAETRLPPDLEIACFRVVQESITNALRHAAATRIDVRVARWVHVIALSIQDDGRGFDAVETLDRAATSGHLGVVGMRERVRGHAGTFVLDTRPGAGTKVSIELPLPGPAT